MINNDYMNSVLFALRPIGGVTTGEMFGGDALYYDGFLFGICFKGRLYFKVNDATREPFLSAGMQSFSPNERLTMRDYYEVPESVVHDGSQLCAWAKRAASTQNG